MLPIGLPKRVSYPLPGSSERKANVLPTAAGANVLRRHTEHKVLPPDDQMGRNEGGLAGRVIDDLEGQPPSLPRSQPPKLNGEEEFAGQNNDPAVEPPPLPAFLPPGLNEPERAQPEDQSREPGREERRTQIDNLPLPDRWKSVRRLRYAQIEANPNLQAWKAVALEIASSPKLDETDKRGLLKHLFESLEARLEEWDDALANRIYEFVVLDIDGTEKLRPYGHVFGPRASEVVRRQHLIGLGLLERD